jgi:hypothetical protein
MTISLWTCKCPSWSVFSLAVSKPVLNDYISKPVKINSVKQVLLRHLEGAKRL